MVDTFRKGFWAGGTIPTAVELGHAEVGAASTDIAEAVAVPDVVTRGKGAGGEANTLAIADTGKLWQARMPLGPERMKLLPGHTADAPKSLASVRPVDLHDETALLANMPKIGVKPAEVVRKAAHRGDITASDLVGPFHPSKHHGHRYAANFRGVTAQIREFFLAANGLKTSNLRLL